MNLEVWEEDNICGDLFADGHIVSNLGQCHNLGTTDWRVQLFEEYVGFEIRRNIRERV